MNWGGANKRWLSPGARFLSILARLAEGVEINFNSPVQEVVLRGEEGVAVVDAGGKEWTADKVNNL